MKASIRSVFIFLVAVLLPVNTYGVNANVVFKSIKPVAKYIREIPDRATLLKKINPEKLIEKLKYLNTLTEIQKLQPFKLKKLMLLVMESAGNNITCIEKNDDGIFHLIKIEKNFSVNVRAFKKSEELSKVLKNLKIDEIFIDKSAIAEDGTTLFDLTKKKNIKVFDLNNANNHLDPIKIELLNRGNQLPILVGKIGIKCCIFSKNPFDAKEFKALLDQPYEKNKIRFLSMVNDTSSTDYIKNSKTIKSVLASKNIPKTREEFENIFRQNEGKQFYILSHIEENAQMVIRDALGNKLFEMSIEDVKLIAQKHHINLNIVGCNTASVPMDLGLSTGNRINSLEFLKDFELAYKKEKSFLGFLETICKINCSIDKSFFLIDKPLKGINEATLYDNELNKVVTIFFFFSYLDKIHN